jgi:hypothetical protein
MCLGGGGGYQPPKRVPAAPAVAGGPPPPDMVNNQVIPSANSYSNMEGNQNAMDPTTKPSSNTSTTSTAKKDQLKLETGRRHDSMIALNPAYREAYQRGDLSGQEGGINL